MDQRVREGLCGGNGVGSLTQCSEEFDFTVWELWLSDLEGEKKKKATLNQMSVTSGALIIFLGDTLYLQAHASSFQRTYGVGTESTGTFTMLLNCRLNGDGGGVVPQPLHCLSTPERKQGCGYDKHKGFMLTQVTPTFSDSFHFKVTSEESIADACPVSAAEGAVCRH